jgi:hypothetical protein
MMPLVIYERLLLHVGIRRRLHGIHSVLVTQDLLQGSHEILGGGYFINLYPRHYKELS